MAYSWISWRHLLNGGSFLSDAPSLCQADTQNQPVQQADTNMWAHTSVHMHGIAHATDDKVSLKSKDKRNSCKSNEELSKKMTE